MRFEVQYIPSTFYTYSFFPLSGENKSIGGSPKENLNFYDKGSVIIQDIALVFRGNIPKFELGVLLGIFTFLYQKVLFVQTTRTVPYSAILKYIKPGRLRRNHQINYRLPNGEQRILKFKMTNFKKRNDEEFASKLEDYINSAKSFIDS